MSHSWCAWCGESLRAKTYDLENLRFCSYICRHAYKYDVLKRHTKPCGTCGKDFETTRLGKLYCSKRCRKAARLIAYNKYSRKRRERLKNATGES